MDRNKFKNNHKTFQIDNTGDFDYQLEESYETPKKWFDEIVEDPKKFEPVTEQILIELKDEAKKCHDSEVANYNIKNSKTNSNYQWMKTVMSKGTVSDKVAAYTVAIQDNPVCGLETLRNLVNMIKASKKKECVAVMDVLTDLFVTDLLRPDQKLKQFHLRPLSLLNELSSGNAITRRKILSVWYFEDQLKELYFNFVTALNNLGHDTVDKNKEKSISAMFRLLAGNPEQEKNLLAFIVNKLGDPSQKVASKAIYSLGQLLFKHPNMQGVVLNEIEKLLFRANVSTKTQYYGLCFLSQFYLSNETTEVARKLIEVYFSFFRACIKKGEVDSRMMSALLMGVNRAYPYAKLEMDKVSEHIDTMYRIVHVASFNIGLHALSLLYQVSDFGNKVSDRFYSALYKKLLDPTLLTTTHQAMLLSLIYKALLKDPETSRIQAFVKRLLQLCVYMQPAFACGVLFLVSQVIGKRKNVQSLILKENVANNLIEDDDDEEKYQDVKDDKNIVIEENDEDDDVKPDVDKLNESLTGPSWFHAGNTSKNKSADGLPKSYNPMSRNPLYCGTNFTAYTELFTLRSHFHPTVALYASNILDGHLVKYSGDPLKDFTLIRFLDRFVFKNPKKVEDGVKRGAHPTFGKRKIYHARGLKSLPINSDSYLKENQRNIPVDELFMYTYLQRKYFEKKMSKQYDDGDGDDSDLESVQSDEFEEMLDKMGGKHKEDEDLDFMTDIGKGLQKKDRKKKRKGDEEEDEDQEDFDEEDLEMDEDDLSGDEIDGSEDDFGDDDLEMNEDDKELFGDLDEDDDEDIVFEENKSHKNKKFKASNKGDDITSLFASAEEFSSLLEDEGTSKIAPGGSNTFSNKDRANVKQLDWEEKRNRWLKGFDSAMGKKKKFGKRK